MTGGLLSTSKIWKLDDAADTEQEPHRIREVRTYELTGLVFHARIVDLLHARAIEAILL